MSNEKGVAFNLNDKIEVTLNDRGVAVYEKFYRDLFAYSGEAVPDLYQLKPGQRVLRMQAWEFMQVFGRELRMGHAPPVSMEVTLFPEKR